MGLNLAKGDGSLRVMKIRCMLSFGGEVNLSAPCHKMLWHVKEPFDV
jgi:hypothetical protein